MWGLYGESIAFKLLADTDRAAAARSISHYLTYTFLFKRLGAYTFWIWEWKANWSNSISEEHPQSPVARQRHAAVRGGSGRQAALVGRQQILQHSTAGGPGEAVVGDTVGIRFFVVRSPRFWVSGCCTKWLIQDSFDSWSSNSLNAKT